jgi:hypothetical protein
VHTSDLNEHTRLLSGCDFEAIDVKGDRWRPSIHMPRRFSRLTLELTEVRVERVRDISEAEALAEGLQWSEDARAYFPGRTIDHRKAFNNFFAITTNLGRGVHNIAATWVWALMFRVRQQNIDPFLKRRELENIVTGRMV